METISHYIVTLKHDGGTSKIGASAACVAGNELLENMEGKFKLHKFPDGTTAKRDRFSKNGGCFGSKKTLVTQLAYLKTPFEFYARIKTLKYESVDDVIFGIMEAVERYEKQVNN